MLSILISIFGTIFGSRQIHRTSMQIAQMRKAEFSIQALFSCSLIVCTFVFFEEPHLLWTLQVLILASIFWTPKVLIGISKRIFLDRFIHVLDQIILGMQSGMNFRSSFKAVIQGESGFKKVQLQEIFNQIVFPESNKVAKDVKFERLISELKETDQAVAKALDRLKRFRQQLRQEQVFRKKESQIKESIQIQMIILLALYLALAVFVILSFGFWQNFKAIIFSAILFSVGILIMKIIGAKHRWKV